MQRHLEPNITTPARTSVRDFIGINRAFGIKIALKVICEGFGGSYRFFKS